MVDSLRQTQRHASFERDFLNFEEFSSIYVLKRLGLVMIKITTLESNIKFDMIGVLTFWSEYY